MYLVDANVVSELRKVRAAKADLGVAAWATSAPDSQLFISVVTLHELEYGVLLAQRSAPQRVPCVALLARRKRRCGLR